MRLQYLQLAAVRLLPLLRHLAAVRLLLLVCALTLTGQLLCLLTLAGWRSSGGYQFGADGGQRDGGRLWADNQQGCGCVLRTLTPITLTPHPALTLRPTRCLHTRQGVGSTSNLGYRKPNKTPRQERESAQKAARYQMKKAAKAAHPQ